MKHQAKNKPAIFLIVIVISIIILVPIFWLFVMSDGHPYSMFVVNKAAAAHLEDSGYTQSDFLESHYVHKANMRNDNYCEGQYMVVFQDEPDVIYYYGVTKDHHEVVQLSEKEKTSQDGTVKTTTEHTIHTEGNCVDSEETSHSSHH